MRALNRSLVHGGNAAADATMFEDRRPTDELRQFIQIYGISPSSIKQIVSKGYKKIPRVLNAGGGYHMEGLHLTNEEENLFKLITTLVEEGKLDEAEETSNSFPFDPNEVEVEPPIGVVYEELKISLSLCLFLVRCVSRILGLSH
ncbi:hypothetical protein BDW42DRAFT_165390 [Aspergillus taichungensis]|uniref:Uncharacterized protein n=1 Tax=Aspergillus taichungensis TaxID=482145 RepID=A0A2J5I0H3_9EURO|nr:hypothetical protein BDW42DRAFT_165390 [Aspergillus taichungensis]